MAINWKVVLSLFVIFAIVGLLLFSPQGQKVTGNRTSGLGSYLKVISGKVTQTISKPGSQKLDIILTNVNPSALGDLEFPVKADEFEFSLDYNTISLLDSSVDLEDTKTINVKTTNFIGTVSFFRNGEMKIIGKANSLKLNSLKFENPNTNFLITGKPVSFNIQDINRKKLEFSSISGTLKWSGLSDPMLLNNAQVELSNFEGNIKQENEYITITGKVDKIVSNGVEITKFKS